VFKAPYKLKDRKSLLKLLKQQDLKGLGGVLAEAQPRLENRRGQKALFGSRSAH
jgi:hypothetical protein